MGLLGRDRCASAPGQRDPTRAPRLARRAALAGLAVLAGALALLRPRRIEVQGWSMAPGLVPGDRLLVVGALGARPGAVVVATDPREAGRRIVKRVAAAGPDGVVLAGDDPARSTDSRHFGPVPAHLVVGRAVWRYAPPDRAGPLDGRGPAPGSPRGDPGTHG